MPKIVRDAMSIVVFCVVVAILFEEVMRVVSRHTDEMRREISDALICAGIAILPESDRLFIDDLATVTNGNIETGKAEHGKPV